MRDVDDLDAAKIERDGLGDVFDFLPWTDENRRDETLLSRLQASSERGLITRMRNGCDQRRLLRRRRNQPIVFFMLPWGGDLGHDAYLRKFWPFRRPRTEAQSVGIATRLPQGRATLRRLLCRGSSRGGG